jgi:hypothetical protein
MQPETLLPVRPSLPYLHTGIKNNQPQDKQKKKEKKKTPKKGCNGEER